MLGCQESGVKSTSGHRISFSIRDILDPKKFTKKAENEHSSVKELHDKSLKSHGTHIFRDQNDKGEESLSGKKIGKISAFIPKCNT